MTSVSYHTNLLTVAQKARPNTYFEAQGSFSTIGAVVLPNNTNWSFAFTPIVNGIPSTNPTVNYGQLTQITLPTGGKMQYQWQTTTSFCGIIPTASTAYGGVTSRTLLDPVSSQASTWTYAALAPSEGAQSPLTHQTTDPLGNVTKHILTNYNYCSWFETETDSYDNNSNLLRQPLLCTSRSHS
ncbi:hypothetical protein HDF10_001233 [Edaphobacter lichenicola]|uniref:Uncharacterized protein n=1 Tax=Tunturiibacter lichenicola TaxID=2051959 RepID=A0A7W8J5Z3_9BACT|nr:hypothetical protein [Edaphobacter lichenicola]